MQNCKVEDCFQITADAPSHAQRFGPARFDYHTEAEPTGQLVCCTQGEMELFGHAGEWKIPADHMVYIPGGRMFRLRAHLASTGVVVQFGREEVAWSHDGCWVGPVNDLAAALLDYACKWGAETVVRNRQAASFFVTLGEMLPAWFCHERINWTPYAEDGAIQRAIDFARNKGPSVSLPEVAGFVGMSERTLRRHLQTELGQGWRDFIRELRMNRAMEMLRAERRSVTQTAFEVGFSSSSAFSNAFVGYVGKTPSAYAKSFAERGAR
jgi:AraC-like DNA-binding protein